MELYHEEYTEDIVDSYINKLFINSNKQLEDAIIKLLIQHGYKIEKPYKIEDVEKIKQELADEGLFVNYVYWWDYDKCKDGDLTCTMHYIVFFDSIHRPMTPDEKANIIKIYKKEDK